MKSEATLKFINRVQEIVTSNEFEHLKFKLFTIDEKYRKAFMNIIFAGYSIQTAFKNYKNLHYFVKNNLIDYLFAIRLITKVAKDCDEGLSVKDLTVYELN